MTDYLDLPIGKDAPETVTVVVEIPLDGTNKYRIRQEASRVSIGPKSAFASALSWGLRLHTANPRRGW